MLVAESAAHPAVAALAQSAYDRLAAGESVEYTVLSDLLDEVSGEGVLYALHRKYSTVAVEAMLMPIMAEITRQAPVRFGRRRPAPGSDEDPLTAPVWPPQPQTQHQTQHRKRHEKQ